MWNTPTTKELERLPRLYENEKKPSLDQVIIHMHFFLGGCDWYAAEFDGEDLFWGFANLNDPCNAEWGYFLLSELKEINTHGIEIDRDLYWRPKKFSEVRFEEEHLLDFTAER